MIFSPSRFKTLFSSLVILFFVASFFSRLWAGAGTTTADILKINQGAKPAAMGGAYSAMGDDAYSINYNPAGLAMLKSTQVILLHLTSLADIYYEYLTFATPFTNAGTMAANVTYRHSPPIDNQNGNPPVNADDFLGSLSYAQELFKNVRLGLTAKYLKSDLASFSASAFGFDAGVQIDNLPFGIRVGLAVQNLGTGMNFSQAFSTPNSTAVSAPLPMFLRFGIGTHQMIDRKKALNIGLEVFKPSDQDIKLALGGEFWVFPDLFAVRGGYKLETLGTPYGGVSDITGSPFPSTPNVFQDYTLGFTLTRRLDSDDFSLDVAYNPADFTATSEGTFFFALNFKFNQLRIF